MAIRTTCPGCQAALTLDDAMRGKKVRCKACEKVLSIPAPGAKAKDLVQDESKVNLRKAPVPAEHDDESEDDRPAKKKKKKKKGQKGYSALILGGVAALVVLLLIGGGVSAFIFLKPDKQEKKQEPQAKAPEAKEKDERSPARIVVPGIKEGNPALKKGGTGIVSNVRGSGYRLERQSEIKQIGTCFISFCDEYKGANQRTLDNFLAYMKRDSGPIHDAIKEGYYQMNMSARLEAASIVCYERDKDTSGHLCVLGSGEVRYLPEPEWKAALGK